MHCTDNPVGIVTIWRLYAVFILFSFSFVCVIMQYRLSDWELCVFFSSLWLSIIQLFIDYFFLCEEVYKFHNRNVGQPTLKKKRPTLLDWIYFKWTYVQCCILFFSVNNQCYVYKKEGCMHIQRFCEAVFWQTNKRLNVMDWRKMIKPFIHYVSIFWWHDILMCVIWSLIFIFENFFVVKFITISLLL